MNANEDLISCSFCNRDNLPITNISSCSHRICTLCLYERIFSNHINEFQEAMDIKIKCKCEKGYLNKNASEILSLIKEKAELEEQEIEENKSLSNIIVEGCECSTGNKNGRKFSEYFCLDCLKFICEKCRYDIKNIHLKHRILKSKELIINIKNNIINMSLKNKTLDDFQEKCDSLSKIFEDEIDKHLNNSLNNIDDLINCLNNLKKDYIEKYKKELAVYLKTFRFIKIFYLNYYKDRKTALKISEEEANDIFKLKYLNNISYELMDIKINHSQLFDKEISKLKNSIDKLKNITKNKLIKADFVFEKIKKNFKMMENFLTHKKFINGLILTKNNNKIITASYDYHMKIWDLDNIEKPIQDIKSKIMNLCALKNGKILASRDNDILIYELNKEKNIYELCQSVTNHDKNISSLSELDDGTIISGGLDKKIIFWEEDPNNKQYKIKQTITTKKEIQLFLVLNNFKFAYAGNDDGIINILEAETELNNISKIVSKEYSDNCQLQKTKGKINCMCKLNQDYFVSGGGDIFNEKKMDHNIYIWKPYGNQYNISQVIHNAHQADVNCIILLRDGRFASSSRDRTIKIWKIDRRRNDKIKYVLNENLDEFKHGLYYLAQLDDDRIVSTSSDNYLVFWKNNNSII